MHNPLPSPHADIPRTHARTATLLCVNSAGALGQTEDERGRGRGQHLSQHLVFALATRRQRNVAPGHHVRLRVINRLEGGLTPSPHQGFGARLDEPNISGQLHEELGLFEGVLMFALLVGVYQLHSVADDGAAAGAAIGESTALCRGANDGDSARSGITCERDAGGGFRDLWFGRDENNGTVKFPKGKIARKTMQR